MKKILTSVMMLIGLVACADYADMPFGYHSVGVDTYGDGVTPVLDGECYALVWIASECEFAGFKYDGSLVDPINNDIVSDDDFYYICPCAQGGKCPPLAFIVKEAYRNAHKNGSYRVVVLDTRVTPTTLAGLNDDGTLRRVNGWGWANVKRDDAVQAKKLSVAIGNFFGAATDQAAQRPADSCDPVITSFSFNEAGDAVVKFKCTKSYYSYLLEVGATPESVGEEKGEDLVEGAADEETECTIVIPKENLPEGGAFFRVGAKMDWMK